MLCVPKMYVPIHTCMLRVINNDTGEEIPRVFQKVAPVVYKKNKRGYTFVAEARTIDQPLQAGRWRMRLIGSLSPLPVPPKNEVNGSFHTRELKDYYVPNDKHIVFRLVQVNQSNTYMQCLRWTAFSCLLTHPNVKGPHFFRRVASVGRIKVPQVLKALK